LKNKEKAKVSFLYGKAFAFFIVIRIKKKELTQIIWLTDSFGSGIFPKYKIAL